MTQDCLTTKRKMGKQMNSKATLLILSIIL